MIPRRARLLITLELLVCFGPVALVLVIAILVTPFWLVALVWSVLDPQDSPQAQGQAWVSVLPLLLVASGVCGLVGLFRVAAVVFGSEPEPRSRRLTLILAAAGLMTIAYFGVSVLSALLLDEGTRWDFLSDGFLGVLVYILLPGFGAIHMLYLARNKLLAPAQSTTEDAYH